jgi:small-conductance mechanosensitive channel
MDGIRDLLGKSALGKATIDWAIALGITVLASCAFALAKGWLVRRLKSWAARTSTPADDVLGTVLGRTRFFFYVAISIGLGSRHLDLPANVERWIKTGIILVTLLQLGLWLQTAVRELSEVWRLKRGDDGGSKTMAAGTVFVSSIAIWSVLLVSALSTLGFEISALVAGLGVGGVAAALAVQSILGDVFASLSIYFDRPFDIGDTIIVGAETGTVEKIGLRTTRVRSISGEEIVFANGDLTKSRIRNYKRMTERRSLFGFGVDYSTSVEALEAIPGIVRAIIESREGLRFDRAHFKEYAESSLRFEVVFFVLSPDYNLYMDHQAAVNLAIFREFQARGIQFGLPVRTIFVQERGRSLPARPEASQSATDLDDEPRR